MKKLIILGLILLAFWLGKSHAQTATAYTISSPGAHSTCATPASGSYFLCVTSDGVWVSNNGAAYFQIVTPAASGVTSVNGKTGAVTISATTTATTTLQ